MWRAYDATGRLEYPAFIETVMRLMPMYWVRVVGGSLYLTGMVLFGYNLFRTWKSRPAAYEEPVVQAAPLAGDYEELTAPRPAGALARFTQAAWHRTWERLPVTFTVMVAVAVIVASLFEIIPTFLIKSNVPTIASVKPYTPLELAGRDLYIREGCFNCHSQMIRPLRYETDRYGEYSKPGEFVYDHPFLWGSRRIGPDLAREGGKYPDLWHVRHMRHPKDIEAKSIMPGYPWMLTNQLDFDGIQREGGRHGHARGAVRRRRHRRPGHGAGAGPGHRAVHRVAGRAGGPLGQGDRGHGGLPPAARARRERPGGGERRGSAVTCASPTS